MSDGSITAAALLGSAARQAADRWSDIDLALRLEPAADPVSSADSWGSQLATSHEIADQLDVWSGPTLYRVFLLADSLQVDLSFWPADEFASNGESWQLLFGEANPVSPPPPAVGHQVVGWGWLYALHTRSALARGRWWQALQMVDGLRDRVITLACRRYGLPDHQGRGVDRLPASVLDPLTQTLVARPDPDQLHPAFAGAVDLLLTEIDHLDPDLGRRLRRPLTILVETARSDEGTAAPARD